MLIITSHGHAPLYEQVAFIRLKRTPYNKFVLFREFGESDLKHFTEKCKTGMG